MLAIVRHSRGIVRWVKAIKSLKNRKAPGPGDIPAELIKCGTDKLFLCIRDLMEKCIRGDEVPKEWKESWITATHKKGRKDDCENYRGLSVTGMLSKIYGKILKAKIEKEWEPYEAEEQAGLELVDQRSIICSVSPKLLRRKWQ